MLPRCGEVDLADQEKRCYGPAGFGFDCRRAEEFEYGEKMVESRKRRGRSIRCEESRLPVLKYSRTIHSRFVDFRAVMVITNNHDSRNGAMKAEALIRRAALDSPITAMQ